MSARHVVLRANASSAVGIGHVIRCRTLAEALVSHGWQATLVSRDLPDPLVRSLADSGIGHAPLPPGSATADESDLIGDLVGGTDSLVVGDGYDLDSSWFGAVHERLPTATVMAIDDLADRPLPVDVVLNQNLGADASAYVRLIPGSATVLAGPRFALLRPEFAQLRAQRRHRDGRIDRILVFMSGADASDVTRRAVIAVGGLGRPVDVVVGAAYPYLSELRTLAGTQADTDVHVNTDSMASLMDRADLAIGAAGSATWERCALGVPAVLVTLADNQVPVGALLVEAGAARSIGWHSSITAADIERSVQSLCDDPERVISMGTAAAAITDGRGAERVVARIEAITARGAGMT